MTYKEEANLATLRFGDIAGSKTSVSYNLALEKLKIVNITITMGSCHLTLTGQCTLS